tara:strand:- start:263 stop:802 length:540 start_codon:yes stop_codon:yes gene_type:complete
MPKAILSLIFSVLFLNITAQNIKFDLIQKALNAPQFTKQVNRQTAFNQNKPLTIYLDSSLIFNKNYNFNNKELVYYDISDPVNRMSPSYNFIFSKISFGEKQTHIGYTFYPNWLILHNGKEFPSYNNNTVIQVYCILEKKEGIWNIKSSTVTDINFPEWMYKKGSGFDYISNNYIPMGK